MLIDYMNDYFGEKKIIENKKSVVKIKKTDWLHNKDKKTLSKSFSFKRNIIREAFIIEMLKLTREARSQLNIKFNCEDAVDVIIEAYSPQISEIEIELSKNVDKIRKDVFYYYAK